ncbi:MAG: response regulator [Chloroflexi bacterium]|nr:response regulator [Chloroflexota bacterium]
MKANAMMHTPQDDGPERPTQPSSERLTGEIARLNERIYALQNELARRAAEQNEAAACAARYRGLAESSQDVTAIVDLSGAIREVMGNTMGIVGCTLAEIRNMGRAEMLAQVHPDDREAFLAWDVETRRWSKSDKTQLRVRDRAGEYRWLDITFSVLFDDSGVATGLMYLARDISERVHAQQALVEAERLSALGQMAGGIAHDFNNILVGVLGYAEKALLDIAEDPASLVADLQRIIASANDAAEAVRRLQSLYRRTDDTSDFAPVDVDALVTEVLALMEPSWKDAPQARGVTVHVETHLAAPAPVLGNAAELRRVLRNLVGNAIDAMPSGGRLTLSTRRERGRVLITVTDTGMGMSDEQRNRLFQPFYTTKQESGSGLGLTIADTIIKRHGGEIDVASALGQGTTFIIGLPAATGLRVAPVLPAPLEAATAPEARARAQILVVEDEEPVRDLLVRLLQRAGHTVTAADDGHRALGLLADMHYDVVITDLGMPEVSGREIAARTHALSPGTPVILSTGWGDTITPEQLQEMGVAYLLTKPYSLAGLQQALTHVLHGRQR